MWPAAPNHCHLCSRSDRCRSGSSPDQGTSIMPGGDRDTVTGCQAEISVLACSSNRPSTVMLVGASAIRRHCVGHLDRRIGTSTCRRSWPAMAFLASLRLSAPLVRPKIARCPSHRCSRPRRHHPWLAGSKADSGRSKQQLSSGSSLPWKSSAVIISPSDGEQLERCRGSPPDTSPLPVRSRPFAEFGHLHRLWRWVASTMAAGPFRRDDVGLDFKRAGFGGKGCRSTGILMIQQSLAFGRFVTSNMAKEDL